MRQVAVGLALLLSMISSAALGQTSERAPVSASPKDAAAKAPAPPSPAQTESLDRFGPIDTPAAAQATLEKALEQMQKRGGGLLLIPLHAAEGWKPANNTQEQFRTPAPPAPAKNWRAGPGVTIVDCRQGIITLSPPQSTGTIISRVLNLPPMQTLGDRESYPMVDLVSAAIRGTSAYDLTLLEKVTAGADRRFYVSSIVGLRPGLSLQSINSKISPVVVSEKSPPKIKSLGYDANSKRWYVIADTDVDIAQGVRFASATDTVTVRSNTDSHNENQTFDICLWRKNYSQGGGALVDAQLRYMSDMIPSSAGGGSVLYSARIENLTEPFRGKVASFDETKQELVYTDPVNADTLGSGRPIINLNPTKCLTGKAYVMQPAGAIIGWGGVIRSTDAAWTREIIGRYFAIDEPAEYVPGTARLRRWWLISGVKDENGVKHLTIVRHWWGAKQVAGITNLYDPSNFTTDDTKPKLLNYIIAPGVNVYDASDGVESTHVNPNGSRRTLRLAASSADGSPFRFAPGDPIEQAVGPDPFRVIPFRSWVFEDIPSGVSSPTFDIVNDSPIQRSSVLRIAGERLLAPPAGAAKSAGLVRYGSAIILEASSNRGIVFQGDTQDAAILIHQPGSATGDRQFINWMTAVGKGFRTVRLSVDDEGGLHLPAQTPVSVSDHGVSGIKSLSAPKSTEAAKVANKGSNLRGLKLAVPKGATSLDVQFPLADADGAFAVNVRTSWITNTAVQSQSARGFNVQFDRPAPQGAFIDWLVVR
jgi:hypothetical protein